MIEIPLTQGKVALVDDADLPLVQGRKWQAQKSKATWYARGDVPGSKGRARANMHNVILGILGVDHRDGDGLNNRRSNLRPATVSQNNANRVKMPSGTSRYKGVRWEKRRLIWAADIFIDNRHKHLGYFTDEDDAARAYNAAAFRLFGEYARPNVIAPPTAGA